MCGGEMDDVPQWKVKKRKKRKERKQWKEKPRRQMMRRIGFAAAEMAAIIMGETDSPHRHAWGKETTASTLTGF